MQIHSACGECDYTDIRARTINGARNFSHRPSKFPHQQIASRANNRYMRLALFVLSRDSERNNV
jgi:hypothetical protein